MAARHKEKLHSTSIPAAAAAVAAAVAAERQKEKIHLTSLPTIILVFGLSVEREVG